MEQRLTSKAESASDFPDMAHLAAVAEGTSEVCRALSNPQRLRMLCALSAGACCVSELEEQLGMSQAYVSGQLARMRAEGLVTSARNGRQMLYSIADIRVTVVLAGLAAAVQAVSAQDQPRDQHDQPEE
ncbi:transcriptional regulator SoxR [Ketogulonicigenium robustum]|uniref:Transcriptional regulator SoxR n=1 Tax=Ketogulonicigenium robustum TaxID=92947 RepID=A0A1W6P0H7_9RHOB|nr:metalloregulator ArsR/SmtB family transcription factor [Ketogulonicigenium robustum]ARO14949.1 transcriptional regulator SoxR [Ketogulonicigenium robustum]